MTQEEKNLLIEVLVAFLPYEIKVQVCNITDYTPVLKGIIGDEIFVQFDYARPIKNGDSTYNIIKDKVKPYLRPLSSMTEEEKKELSKKYVYSICGNRIHAHYHSEGYWDDDTELDSDGWEDLFNWLNAHHFDYRGLIEKGLALPAPEGMYNTK